MALDRAPGWLLSAALLPGILSGCAQHSEAPLAPGASFPVVQVQRLDGSAAPLDAYAGKALVVNFWATWCEPCREEMPSLQRLSQSFAPEALAVVGVTVDEDLNLVREFVLRYRIGFPIYADRDGSARRALRVGSYPLTYLVTRERKVAGVVAVTRDWAAPEALAEIGQKLGIEPLPAAGKATSSAPAGR